MPQPFLHELKELQDKMERMAHESLAGLTYAEAALFNLATTAIDDVIESIEERKECVL